MKEKWHQSLAFKLTCPSAHPPPTHMNKHLYMPATHILIYKQRKDRLVGRYKAGLASS